MSWTPQSHRPLAGKKILITHHWPLEWQRQPVFSDNALYVNIHGEKGPGTINVPPRTQIDMGSLAGQLKKHGFEPDLFIAKVDAFFPLVPRNVAALKCPTVLILGDTQHGKNPLVNMTSYATSEKYDYYITDHKRHHLWFYHLAGIEKSYWLPGLFLNPPPPGFAEQPFFSTTLSAEKVKDKAVFIGQARNFHPRRLRLLPKALKAIPYFITAAIPQADSMKVYNIADLSLNISLNGDLNLRCLEIIAAGGMQLADRLSDEAGLALLLEEDKEIALFDTESEMLEKIRLYHDDRQLNQRVRSNSYQRYVNEYAPDKMEALFKAILEGRTIDSRFTSDSVPRLQYIKDRAFSTERLQVYEFVQEQHKENEFIRVLFDGRVSFSSPVDFLDLPRLEVTLINRTAEMARQLEQYVKFAPDAERLKSVQEIGPEEKFDIIITSNLESSLVGRLCTLQSHVICLQEVAVPLQEAPALNFLSKAALEKRSRP